MGLIESLQENNILMASWIDDMGRKQKDFDDKILFYNNESILTAQNLKENFSQQNR